MSSLEFNTPNLRKSPWYMTILFIILLFVMRVLVSSLSSLVEQFSHEL